MQPALLTLLALCLTGLLIWRRRPALGEKLLPWLACASLAIPLFSFVHAMQWTTLMGYDDEGYVLHSMRDFLTGGGLYDRVYSQYGPFYFLFWKLLSFVGLQPIHVHGRALTLVLWLACSSGSALLAWRLSRHWLATAAALAGSCIFLWPMSSEPSHPGSLVCLLGIAAALLLTGAERGSRLASALLGAIAACLLLTKINTGVFLCAALAAWWLLRQARTQSRPSVWLWLLVCLGLALLPWALMRPLLGQAPMAIFALVASSALLAVVLAADAPLSGPASRPSTNTQASSPPLVSALSAPARLLARLPWGMLGLFAATTLATLLFCLLTGTSPGGLLEGVLLAPLRFPNSFTTPVNWRFGAGILAPLAPLACFVLLRLKPAWRPQLLRLACLPLLLGFFLSWSDLIALNMQAFVMSYGLAASWVFVMPVDASDEAAARLRQGVGLVLLLQALQAFPVGGSQISWGCVLWIPLCCAAAIPRLLSALHNLPLPELPLKVFLGATAAAALFLGTVHHASEARTRLAEGIPLGLPGAESILPPSSTTATLRILCANARQHGDLLFSEPGVYSFNLWTGLPAPTSDNATLWFRLLTPAAQQRIAQTLDRHPRALVIRENSTLDYLHTRHIPVEGPLVSHIDSTFTAGLRLDNYSLLWRSDRPAPRLLGILYRQPALENGPTEVLSTVLPNSWVPRRALLELHLLDQTSSHLLISAHDKIRPLSLVPLDPGTSELRLQIPRLPPNTPLERLLLIVRDLDGSVAGVARFPSVTQASP